MYKIKHLGMQTATLSWAQHSSVEATKCLASKNRFPWPSKLQPSTPTIINTSATAMQRVGRSGVKFATGSPLEKRSDGSRIWQSNEQSGLCGWLTALFGIEPSVKFGPSAQLKENCNVSANQDVLDNYMLPPSWEEIEDGHFLGVEKFDWPMQNHDLNFNLM